jgi:hypothetical protein
MLYFLPWVALLLLSVLAIPIASMMDKRRAQAVYEEYESGSSDSGGGFDGIEDEPLEPLDEGEEPVMPVDDVSEGLAEDGMIEVPQDSVEAFGSDEQAFQ